MTGVETLNSNMEFCNKDITDSVVSFNYSLHNAHNSHGRLIQPKGRVFKNTVPWSVFEPFFIY